jgi:rubrerythrin
MVSRSIRGETMPSEANKFLDICIRIEKKISELYLFFSEQYREMPELSSLWRKTAHEEENHMLQFQMAARLSKCSKFSAVVSLDNAQQALAMVTGLQKRIMEHPPTWFNALKFAIELEDRMSQFHTHTALAFEDASFNSLYHAMMKHDQDHVQALKRYLEKPTDQEV